VRGTKNPDLTAVRDLAPDLVLASEEENRELDVRRLRDAGLAVYVTRVRSLADLPGSLTRLGRVLGVEDRARALVDRLVAPEPAGDGAVVRVACAIWRDEPSGAEECWWLLGPDTYAASLLVAAGGHLVPAEPGGRYPRRSLSVLRAAAPDLVLLPDEPYAFGAEEVTLLAAEGLRGVPVDGKALWWWGCRTPAAIDHLAGLLRTSAPSRSTGGQ
jgi:ABC-type Fe3+-hydroxamate transport system substrate-binding protein